MIKAILFDFDGVLTIDKTGSASITAYIALMLWLYRPIFDAARIGRRSLSMLCKAFR